MQGDGECKGVISSLTDIGVDRSDLGRDLGSYRTRSGEEQVSQFYGGSRKVTCGLGFRDGRLTCSVLSRNTEQQQPTQKPNNDSTARL